VRPQPPRPARSTAKTRSEHARRTGPSATGRPASAGRRHSRPVPPQRLCGRCAAGGMFGIRVSAVHEINTSPDQTPSTPPLRTIMHWHCRSYVSHGRLSRAPCNAPEKSVADVGSCWVKCSCLDSGRFSDDACLWPSHLRRVPQIMSSLGHRSVRQPSGGCPLSRVGHVGVEGGAKNPGESRQVITAIVQYVWTRSSL
jgi:hypothetical protein